jgi:hypothetical protein
MTRTNYLIARAIMHACHATNSADCAEGEEQELTTFDKNEIVDYVKEHTSKNQRESLLIFIEKLITEEIIST